MVPYVNDMARHFSAELTLVHAYLLRPAYVNRDLDSVLVYGDVYNDLAYDPQLVDEARRSEEQRVREFAAKMFPGYGVRSDGGGRRSGLPSFTGSCNIRAPIW